MKVFLLNGSPHKNGCTNRALEEVAKSLQEEGIQTNLYWIGNDPIRGCQACYACAKHGNNRCVFDDDVVNKLIEAALDCDGIVVGSPVYYAGANASVLAVLDRTFCSASSQMKFKVGAGISSARRAGTTLTIDQINKYFQISCMPVASSTYWPMVHGSCADDVERDLEGLQTMRHLGKNMAWMFHGCIMIMELSEDIKANLIGKL
ncbi:MAG: flavodoxin family protein, partial [Coriobacteriales bacterium]|nr:flavodoxin family protein [Coriobacteriales bacterium]